MPLALDTGVVCVEGFADADDVQARLIGQFGQELRNLRGRFACDNFFPHVAVHCRKEEKKGEIAICTFVCLSLSMEVSEKIVLHCPPQYLGVVTDIILIPQYCSSLFTSSSHFSSEVC